MEELAQAGVLFALWLGVVLIAAKAGAEISERVFGQPAVVGELVAGVIIGPFALGGIVFPEVGALFPQGASATPVPESLWVFGQVAAVLLLFVAGLETDFASFRRFGPAATAVATGGVILPFILGDGAAIVFGFAEGPLDPEALFMGVVLTATSLGVTARLLSDLGKLDTPEGVTILGAAVIDDVLGVIVLALVVAVTASGALEPVEFGLLALRTIVLWLVLTGVLLAIAGLLARFMNRFMTAGAVVSLAFAVALLAGVVAESVGLAMIIGAYSAGLALSRSTLRERLLNDLRVVQHVLVPAFFVTMGMLVDLGAIVPVLGLGILLTALAAIGKVIGCSLPALAAGFTGVGALRIGIGMIPRGEVALIVAGLGLASGMIDESIFGIGVLIAIATTVITPAMLKPAFLHGAPGLRGAVEIPQREERVRVELRSGLAEAFERNVIHTLTNAGFEETTPWEDLHGGHGVDLERGKELVSFESRELIHDQVLIRLESEAPVIGLNELVRAAAQASAAETTAALLSALRFDGETSASTVVGTGDPAVEGGG